MPILLDVPDPLEPSPQPAVHPGPRRVEDAEDGAPGPYVWVALFVGQAVLVGALIAREWGVLLDRIVGVAF